MNREANDQAFNSVFDTRKAPLPGPGARPGTLSEASVNQQVDQLLRSTGIASEPGHLIRSLTLLWHDHLNPSHAISQSIEGADGSYLHGIMHRREPDFGNAAYWFRRVGDHPIYPELAGCVTGLNPESDFTARLVRGGRWNALAMIDACEAVEVGSADVGDAECVREVQSIEFKLLLKHFCAM